MEKPRKSAQGVQAVGQRHRLGRGRSGEVWLVQSDGAEYAEKVFLGDTLSNYIHYVVSGAPNPYIWNENAVWAAFERRRILKILLPFWFGREMDIADALGVGWSEDARVFTLSTEYVSGPFTPLLHPFRHDDGRLNHLSRRLLPRLQCHLEEAGFDGLVWQAGKGNPVALNNFLLEGQSSSRYIFIDAESGVPALFSISPGAQLHFYLPRALRYGHPLFDDVDTDRLTLYLKNHGPALSDNLEPSQLIQLHQAVEKLASRQKAWKNMRRHERSITYQVVKGRLSEEAARYYHRHPWRWRLREGSRVFRKVASALTVKIPRSIVARLSNIDLRAHFANAIAFSSSQEYRTRLGESYVRSRIEQWRSRRQLSEAEAAQLHAELDRTRESGAYISDFGAHIGMKVSFLALEIIILGGLSLAGVPLLLLAALFLIDGPIYRTIYTLYRSVVATARLEGPPVIALVVGVLPLLGSLAYPAQMLWRAEKDQDKLAQFIIYDTITNLGSKIPILGGRDTATEHAFNRLAARLLRPNADALSPG